MTNIPEPEQKKPNNIILYISIGILFLAIALVIFIISVILFSVDTENGFASSTSSISSEEYLISDIPSADNSSITSDQKDDSSEDSADKKNGLDPDFTNLILVNNLNPLPKDYDYESNLGTLDSKYIKGSFRQLDKDVIPYITAMLDAAWEDEVELYISSPYRSYERQSMLFKNKIDRVMKSEGLDRKAAEEKAATVVARPGTSEHHTGLAVDFNSVDASFEATPMFKWLKENAEDYGFIMRYSEEKHEFTGIIHESWHWRFVGINAAKEINNLGMCLEEYLLYKGIENNYNVE